MVILIIQSGVGEALEILSLLFGLQLSKWRPRQRKWLVLVHLVYPEVDGKLGPPWCCAVRRAARRRNTCLLLALFVGQEITGCLG